jgi:hypothetical protein
MGKNRRYNTRSMEKTTKDMPIPSGRPPDDAQMPLEPDPETRQVSGEESGLYGDGETASPSATSNSETRELRPESGQIATQDAAQTSEIKSTQDEQNVRPLSGLGSSASTTS